MTVEKVNSFVTSQPRCSDKPTFNYPSSTDVQTVWMLNSYYLLLCDLCRCRFQFLVLVLVIEMSA